MFLEDNLGEKEVTVEGNSKGKPRAGAFEVTVEPEGTVLYSKLLDTSRKPGEHDIEDILTKIETMKKNEKPQ